MNKNDKVMRMQLFAAPEGTTVDSDLAKVVAKDYTIRFVDGINKLRDILGIVKPIPFNAGEDIKVYKVTGELEDGSVAEGEVIPLSEFKTTYESVGTAAIKKWRKNTTVEAVAKKGYQQAINDTDKKAVRLAQDKIRTSFFSYIGNGTGAASGDTLQAVLAQAWGQLQVIWEDTTIEPVFFVNPLDVADYLATASITTQTAFGFQYIENFLGLGLTILDSRVEQGTIKATAIENINLGYVPITADIAQMYPGIVIDETGYVGLWHDPKSDNASTDSLILTGTFFFAERLGGVVVGVINSNF